MAKFDVCKLQDGSWGVFVKGTMTMLFGPASQEEAMAWEKEQENQLEWDLADTADLDGPDDDSGLSL